MKFRSEMPKAGFPPFLIAAICLILLAGVDIRINVLLGFGPQLNLAQLFGLAVPMILLAERIVDDRAITELLAASHDSNKYVGYYFVAIFVSGLVGVYWQNGSLLLLGNTFPSLILFYLIAASTGGDPDQNRHRLIWALLMAAAPNIILAISQYLLGGPYPVPPNINSAAKMDVDGRIVAGAVVGLFNHPNALAIYLTPIPFIAFGQAIKSGTQRPVPAVFALLIGSAALICIYMTRTKGVWLWMLIAPLLVLGPSLFFKRRPFSATVLCISLVVMIWSAVTWYSLDQGGVLSTIGTRYRLWATALDMLFSEPRLFLFGNGSIGISMIAWRDAGFDYANAHNAYLNQFLCVGIFSFALYVLMIVRSVYLGFNKNYRIEDTSSVLIAFIGLAGAYFFEPVIESTALSIQLLTLVALLSVKKYRERTHG